MNNTDNTVSSKHCSKCGTALSGTYFVYGGGQNLCGLCQRYQMPSGLVYFPSPPDYTVDWLKENVRLAEELNHTRRRIADLEASLKEIASICSSAGRDTSLEEIQEIAERGLR